MAICSSATPSPRASSILPPNQDFRCRRRRRLARRPIHPRRPLDVHQHVAAPRLGDQLEHLLRAAGDVVDDGAARRQRPPRHLDRKVSAETGTPGPTSPSIAGTSAAASSSADGGPLRAATAPHVEHVEAGLDQLQPVGDRLLGVPLRAPSNIESTVTLTIPAATAAPGPAPIGERQITSATVATDHATECVYTDLDGTLLGRGSSLFRDAEAASRWPRRAGWRPATGPGSRSW